MGKRWLERNMRNRIIIILLVVIIGIGLYYTMNKLTGRDNIDREFDLLKIDDVSIPEEEFQWFLQDEKAGTASYFYQKYGVEYTDQFWEAAYGDEVPIEVAKLRALERLLKVKIEQALAVDYRLLKGSSTADVAAAMEAAEKSSYGAANLEPFQEYMLFHQRLVLDVKQQYKMKAKAVSEQELMEFYTENKEQLFTLPDDLLVKQISWISNEPDEERPIVQQLVEELQNGITVEQVLPKYQQLNALQIQEKQFGANESKDENSSSMEVMLKDEAYRLGLNEISDWIPVGNRNYVLICMKRNEGHVIDFSEVSLLIEDALLEEQYEQFIKEGTKRANVSIKETGWNSLEMH